MNLVRTHILTLNNIESSNPRTHWLGQTSIIFEAYTNFHIWVKLSPAARTLSLVLWVFSLCRNSPTLSHWKLSCRLLVLSLAELLPLWHHAPEFLFPSATPYSSPSLLSLVRPLCSAWYTALCAPTWSAFLGRKPEVTNMTLTFVLSLFLKITILCCLLSNV